MSFDQHSIMVVLDMMRGMYFMPGMGLGQHQHGPMEFVATVDHDTSLGLGFVPTEADYKYRAHLHRERVRARLTCTPFDYLICPYRMSLQDYFVKESEVHPHMGGFSVVTDIERVDELQHQETTDFRVDVEPTGVIGGVVRRDEYRIEMHMMSMSQIAEMLMEDVTIGADEFEDTFGFIEGTSDFVDPPISFDILSRFISRSDDVYDSILDIDGEITQPDSNRDSSNHDSDPIDERVSPATGDVETIDFGTDDQPRELKICLDPSIFQRHLPILPHVKPVKQKLRQLHPRWSLQVKEEIQKQLSVGFISVVEYPEWLVNIILVPKKDGKVRVCVDFRDLNKASPKDDFPFPHIDLLVDSTVGHSMLSFMDGFSGYNQIMMALDDMEKTTFITEWGTYCYRVMPFGLKNAGTTYQRVATTLFHDMMHRDVEVYVDDMIVKSRSRADHLAALKRFFERIQKFRLRLNPKKCTFGVTSRKLLGHMVNERDICEPIFRLLRKNQPTVWNDDCQIAFENIKEYLFSPPVLVSPMSGRPLLSYLSVSDMALGSLVQATRKLRHYMTEYSVCLICRLDPLRYLFDRPVLTGRLMRWIVLLSEFDIQYVSQKFIKGSIVADHLGSLSISKGRPIDDDFPDEEFVAMTSLSSWHMYFDGAANQSGFGIDVLLISSQGDHILRFAPVYYCLIGETEAQDDLPWYHDIHQLLRSGTYLEAATAKL
ncbi:Retrovirus-related Pol polyprotein from transposon 17.6 [Vitis vinifera]|uniref:Retrovirus-related Pol polyprotein from transposon 17.6 n=1 Tax=Vitis vinifera TaxID=29760 RepID=A0A438HKM3_VITVI|nr:Retrovirus-related Pol polyprotein from transposon 17.6 [Vitis vinifera]